MVPDDYLDAALDRLLESAVASGLSTLNSRIDVTQRLRELHDDQRPPSDDEGGAINEPPA